MREKQRKVLMLGIALDRKDMDGKRNKGLSGGEEIFCGFP